MPGPSPGRGPRGAPRLLLRPAAPPPPPRWPIVLGRHVLGAPGGSAAGTDTWTWAALPAWACWQEPASDPLHPMQPPQLPPDQARGEAVEDAQWSRCSHAGGPGRGRGKGRRVPQRVPQQVLGFARPGGQPPTGGRSPRVSNLPCSPRAEWPLTLSRPLGPGRSCRQAAFWEACLGSEHRPSGQGGGTARWHGLESGTDPARRGRLGPSLRTQGTSEPPPRRAVRGWQGPHAGPCFSWGSGALPPCTL